MRWAVAGAAPTLLPLLRPAVGTADSASCRACPAAAMCRLSLLATVPPLLHAAAAGLVAAPGPAAGLAPGPAAGPAAGPTAAAPAIAASANTAGLVAAGLRQAALVALPSGANTIPARQLLPTRHLLGLKRLHALGQVPHVGKLLARGVSVLVVALGDERAERDGRGTKGRSGWVDHRVGVRACAAGAVQARPRARPVAICRQWTCCTAAPA